MIVFRASEIMRVWLYGETRLVHATVMWRMINYYCTPRAQYQEKTSSDTLEPLSGNLSENIERAGRDVVAIAAS